MTRFMNDTLLMDNSITIGQIPMPLNNAILVNATLTDNNSGQANNPDISINVAAGQTAVITFVCSEYLKQVNSFLNTSTSNPLVDNNGNLLVQGDAPKLKGIMVTGFELAFSIQAGPLTSQNFRADYANFKNNTANTFTNIFPNTEFGVAARANTAAANVPRVVNGVVASPAFDVTDNTVLYAKISPVTPGGCTYRLYSFMLNVAFNYN